MHEHIIPLETFETSKCCTKRDYAKHIHNIIAELPGVAEYQVPTISEIMESIKTKIPFSVNCYPIQYKFNPKTMKLNQITLTASAN